MTQDTSSTTVNNKVTSEYTAEDIHVLGDREAVRLRPGMYIGNTDQSGLQHLAYEITYNSIDEAMAGCCSKITVTIQTDNSIKVEDNGRGEQSKPTETVKIEKIEITVQ